MRALPALLALIAVPLALAQNQPAIPQVVHPGETITVTSAALVANDKITVRLKPVADVKGGTPACTETTLVPFPIGVAAGVTSISVGVPPDTCLGPYQVVVEKDTNGTAASVAFTSPEYLQITQKPPVVNAIYPKALFKDEAPHGAPSHTVGVLSFLGPLPAQPDTSSGTKPGATPDSGYALSFSNRPLMRCPVTDSDQAPPRNGVSCYQQAPSEPGQISFYLRGDNLLQELSGKQSVSLVRNGSASAPQDLAVVNADRTTPRNYAVIITAALVVLVYIMLNAARKALAKQPRAGSSLLNALFLDEQTQTYSLSKCQFYAWTLAAILGYVFFAVSRSVIQGSAVFPDIPGGLPAILLFSAGTSVVSTGITSSKGSKGAGELHPSLGDFITTGGVVAPERLQFVVWTAVGVFTFLTIVFKSDPLTLSDLPNIPEGFLQLMGISSAGYLAGKLARKPGPVITTLSVTSITPIDFDPPQPAPPQPGQPAPAPAQPPDPNQPVMVVNIRGQNLDPRGKIKISGKPLRADMFVIDCVGAGDPQANNFCTEMNVTLNSAAEYVNGDHTLTLVNSDAQSADVTFPVDCMTIDKLDVPAGPNPVADPAQVDVEGKNFVNGTRFRWYNAQETPLAALADATFHNATKLTVTRPEAAVKGSNYILKLVSPLGLRVSKKV